MGAIVNGMALSRLRAYGCSFLIFCDYMQPADPALGASWSCRSSSSSPMTPSASARTARPTSRSSSSSACAPSPACIVIRPGRRQRSGRSLARDRCSSQDGRPAWCSAAQALPTLDRTQYAPAAGVARGAYVLADAPEATPEVILIGTGSEVQLCVEAHETLAAEGIAARVVSMPCWELFEEQDQSLSRQRAAAATSSRRVAVEQAAADGLGPLCRRDGRDHRHAQLRRLGAHRRPLQAKFGFTAERGRAAAARPVELATETRHERSERSTPLEARGDGQSSGSTSSAAAASRRRRAASS